MINTILKAPPLDQEQDFDRTYLQNPNCRTYITAHKTCNRKSSGNRERTIITSTSNNIIREGCETISNRCSDRKYKKRQNSTNKQIMKLITTFFLKYKITSLKFLFEPLTRIFISSGREKFKKSGASPDGFQTFEHHQNFPLNWGSSG